MRPAGREPYRSDCSNQPDGGDPALCELGDDDLSREGEAEEGLRAAVRVIGLFCTLALCVGSHYAGNALNSLKAAIKADLGITNAQYGTLSSAVATVNTILPIFGGVFLDSFGTACGSIMSTGLILLGTGITAVSAFAKVSNAYQLLVFGRVVYALGAGTVVVAQQSIISSWFRGKGLAVAFGLQIAVGRLSSFLAAGTVVPIQNWTGHWGWALWVAFFLCCFSFLMNLAYIAVVQRAAEEAVNGRPRPKKFSFNLNGIIRLTDIFWLVILIEGLLYGAWTPFLHMNAEMIKVRFGLTDSLAGWQSSWAHVAPIFISPFMGSVIDRYGHRTTAMIASAVLLLFSVALFGLTMVNPAIGMVIFSLSITIGPIAINSSPALLCPPEMTGTCIGLLKAAGNAVASAADPLLGLVQDLTPGKTYDYVNVVYACMAIAAMALSVLLLHANKGSHGGVLDLPEGLRRAQWTVSVQTTAGLAALSRAASGSAISKPLSRSNSLLREETGDVESPHPRSPLIGGGSNMLNASEWPRARKRRANYVYCGILFLIITVDWALFAYGTI